MTKTLTPKVLVVGGGPGGYVAAIRCGQLGLDTVLVEGDQLGGTCLIRGCIPSKALIHAAEKFNTMQTAATNPVDGISISSAPELDLLSLIGWKEGIVDRLNSGVASLLRRANVRVVKGWGEFSDAKTCHVRTEDEIVIRPEHVILANGSKPVALDALPFGGKILSSTGILSLTELPRKLVVVGGGYIGLELGMAFSKFGSKVTIVEAQSSILSQYDRKLVDPIKTSLDKNGISVLTDTLAIGETPRGLSIQTSGKRKSSIQADAILVTVGRAPNTSGWGLSQMALKMNGDFIAVNEQCATSSKNVWAIGDIIGDPMLAHKASAQGEMVAEIIAGKRRAFLPEVIPEVCFTDPEIVSVGASPDEEDTTTSVFPLAANGRALSMHSGDNGGFVRVVAHKETNRILGIQAVGTHVSELSASFVTSIEMGAVLEDISHMVFAHPTLGESFHEASLKGLGHAIHV